MGITASGGAAATAAADRDHQPTAGQPTTERHRRQQRYWPTQPIHRIGRINPIYSTAPRSFPANPCSKPKENMFNVMFKSTTTT